ncbi:MAG: glycerate kinase [Dermatophilaceae bacterium]
MNDRPKFLEEPVGHVLIAPDKFKGTLSAAEVAAHVAAGMRSGRPDLEVEIVPVADGGDGTLAAAVAAGFTRVPVMANGPTRRHQAGGTGRDNVQG